MAATTVAVERMVLRHLHEQVATLEVRDARAVHALQQIIEEEQEHHERSAAHLPTSSWWTKVIDPVVASSTEAVIWLGMRL